MLNHPRSPLRVVGGTTALLALLLAPSSCGRGGRLPQGVVATIDGEEVSDQDFEAFVQEHLGDEVAGLDSKVLVALFDQYINERLLFRLAVDRLGAEAQAGRRSAIRSLLEEAMSEEANDAEVNAYYEAHLDEYTYPERVRLRQILVEDRGTAEEALERLRQGAGFADVARLLSVDPSAPIGGYQGELSRQDLPDEEFVSAIFDLEPGETSDILDTDYGHHIFLVEARLPEEVLPLDAASPQIRQTLRTRQGDRVLANLVATAREKYNVQVDPRNLSFHYTGSFAADENP